MRWASCLWVSVAAWVLGAGGCGGAHAGEERGLAASLRAVLADPAATFEVVSLDPDVHRAFGYGAGSEAPEPLRRWQVALAEADGVHGRVRVDDAATRRAILEGLEAGLAAPGPPAGCYDPRHALVARTGDVTVAVHLCFACNFALPLEAGTRAARLTSLGDPQGLQARLNALLQAAGVPLAPPLGSAPAPVTLPADGPLAAWRDPDALTLYAIDEDLYRDVGHNAPPAGKDLLGHALGLLEAGEGVKARVALTRASARAALLRDVEHGLTLVGDPAECYNPRHALVLTKGGERVVAFLCLECSLAAVAHARTPTPSALLRFADPGRLAARLDLILGHAAPASATTFDVLLTSVGASRIQVVKVLRELTGLGLRDAVALADRAPATVLSGVDRARADQAVKALTTAGGSAQARPHAAGPAGPPR